MLTSHRTMLDIRIVCETTLHKKVDRFAYVVIYVKKKIQTSVLEWKFQPTIFYYSKSLHWNLIFKWRIIADFSAVKVDEFQTDSMNIKNKQLFWKQEQLVSRISSFLSCSKVKLLSLHWIFKILSSVHSS